MVPCGCTTLRHRREQSVVDCLLIIFQLIVLSLLHFCYLVRSSFFIFIPTLIFFPFLAIISLATASESQESDQNVNNVTPNDLSQRLKSAIGTASTSTSSHANELNQRVFPDSLSHVATISKERKPLHRIDCRALRMGQFSCPQAEIDPETEQPKGCTTANLAPLNCTLRPGLICDEDKSNSTFYAHYVHLAVACEHTAGTSFETTLLLSVFLGFLGADRFYLGYGALGLLKLSTLGFLFLGHFVDLLLIAMQVVGPADGSAYIIKHYGPRLTILRSIGDSGLLVPSPNATRVFESQYEHYFYWPANYSQGNL